jgi:hypothetical protein
MDICKALYRGDGARAWFPEVFVCNIPGRTISIKVFQPLFTALDQLRQYNMGRLLRSQLTTSFLSTVRPDHLYISNGLEKCYSMQIDAVKDKRVLRDHTDEFQYECIRSLVFEEDGNTCVVSLDMIEDVVNVPETGTVEDNLVAVMALFLWKNSYAGLSDRVQALQQSPLELHRQAASVFTTLLHPLVQTFRQIFPKRGREDSEGNGGSAGSGPLLYSTRKRCTSRQINKLKRGLASNNKQDVSVTSTSLMSLSTSYLFCKKYEKIESANGLGDDPICPMMLTIQVHDTELPMFIPVFDYVREDFETERNKEHEVLLFPGAKMVFHDIEPAEIEEITGATTAEVDIVGMDVSNIMTQQEIAISNRVVTMVMSNMAGIDLGASAYDTTRSTKKFEW